MKTRLLLVLCAAVGLALAGKHDQYSNYTVHGVWVRDAADVALLQRLEGELQLDAWQHGVPREQEAQLMVAPVHEYKLLRALDDAGLKHNVHVENVAEFLEKQDEELTIWRSRRGPRAVFQDYLRYAQIDEYMERIVAQYPDLVTIVNAGKSFQGRDIKYFKISTTDFEDPSKPIYFMNAMIHAREWVTTPVTLYAIHRLVENLRNQDRDLREDVDWIIMPLTNPDGYEYSHVTDRLWRKTRSLNPALSLCYGVDGNRNFDVQFNTLGVSRDPCSNTFPGTRPFSEPETGYVRDIFKEYVDRIEIYMDIHSHGNWVLYGFGNHSLPSNAAQLHLIGAAMGASMDRMKLPQATYYRVGNSATLLYATSGSTQDYGQQEGVPFSYTLELPGYGYGFLVPPHYMDHVNEETWEGIAASARLARAYYRARYEAATTTPDPTTADPTTADPTTADPTTADPTTADPTTADPTTADPTTADPTTADPTTADPTTADPDP